MPALIETVAATGQFPYVLIHNPDGTLWNKTLNAGAGGWEAYAGGHWTQYAIPLTEQAGSGYYSAPYPSAISGVLTTEVVYFNATPTLGDAPGGLGQALGSDIGAVGGDGTAPAKLKASLASMVLGAAVTGTLTPTAFTTNVVNPNVNAFQGRSLLFTTGNLVGQGGTISEYDPGTGLITVAASFTTAPVNGDAFVIL